MQKPLPQSWGLPHPPALLGPCGLLWGLQGEPVSMPGIFLGQGLALRMAMNVSMHLRAGGCGLRRLLWVPKRNPRKGFTAVRDPCDLGHLAYTGMGASVPRVPSPQRNPGR